MMPSRGLRLLSTSVNASARRHPAALLPNRQLSTFRSLNAANKSLLPIKPTSHYASRVSIARSPVLRYGLLPSFGTGIRLQSSQAQVTEQAVQAGSKSLEDVDLTSFASQLTPTEIAAIPEKIGYFHEVGLTWGSPYITESIAWLLEHVHIWTATPWFVSILLTSVAIRTLMIPSYIRLSNIQAKMSGLQPILRPVMERAKAAQKNGDRHAMMMAIEEQQSVYRQAGVKPTQMLLPMVIPGMLGFCSFKLLRAIATLPVPGLKTGGFLWFQDLTVSDPFYILPAAGALFLHMLIRRGGESGVQMTQSDTLRNIAMYGMPGLLFTISFWQPGTVQLTFTVAILWGFAQGWVLRQPAVRKFLRLHPIVPPQPLQPLQPAASPPPAPSATIRDHASLQPTYQAPNTPTAGQAGGSSANMSSTASNSVNSPRLLSSSNAASPESAASSAASVNPFTSLMNTLRKAKKDVREATERQTGWMPDSDKQRRRSANASESAQALARQRNEGEYAKRIKKYEQNRQKELDKAKLNREARRAKGRMSGAPPRE